MNSVQNRSRGGIEALGTLAWALASALLFAASLWMATHDWEHGRMRSALMGGAGLAIFFLRWPFGPLWIFRARAIFFLACAAAAVALGLDLRVGLESLEHARTTGEIRLDQGQNLYRSAQLVARGEDPYGRGALVDMEAYKTRLQLRAQLGLAPRVRGPSLGQAFFRYSAEPLAALRDQLLPAPGPAASPEAEREYRLLGHKYGPLPIALELPFVRLGPASIPALQLGAFLCWIAALVYCLLAPKLRLAPAAMPIAIALILLEPHVASNYLHDSASDAWGLAFCALALGAFLREKPALAGLAVALGLGCKAFPAALFIPLLFQRPLRRALIAFAIGSAATFLPFFLWDPRGLWMNLVAWPSLMAPDNTSWLPYFPDAGPIARPLLLIAVAVLSAVDLFGLRVRAASPRLYFVPVDRARTLAHFTLVSACAVLAGSALHNNYVPWVTSWGFCAIAAAFAV